MALNLAHRHAAGVERQYLVVKAAPAGLVLGDELGLERARAVAWDFNGQGAKVAFECFFAAPISGVASFIGDHLVLVMTQVVGHLGLKCPLDQGLGQLLQQAVLAYQIFGLFVVCQQCVNQVSG